MMSQASSKKWRLQISTAKWLMPTEMVACANGGHRQGASGGCADALPELTKFVVVGFVPDGVETWVVTKLLVFECLSGFFVKDRHGPGLE